MLFLVREKRDGYNNLQKTMFEYLGLIKENWAPFHGREAFEAGK